MYMLQLMFFISVNCCFSFVLNSLAYITIPKNNGKMKINWKKLTTTSFCYNIYKIYIKTLKLVILPLMNALYRFTQLTDSVTTFISFQHDSSCLHLLIHTGFLGLVIQINQLYISTWRHLTAILDHLNVRCTASLPRAAARAGVTQATRRELAWLRPVPLRRRPLYSIHCSCKSISLGRVTDACLVFVNLICLPKADWLPPRVLTSYPV